MEEKEMQELFDLANAEETSRSIARIVKAFLVELSDNCTLPVDAVNDLAVFYGKAFISKIFLEPTVLEEISEEE